MRTMSCGIGLVMMLALACAQPFTYQGFLRVSGNPANGTFDFRFRLYDASSGGTQVGTDQFANDLTVQNGLFTTAIDFGAVWTGADRYLEIAVRPGSSTGGYQELLPRVRISPTPYAIRAATAGAANPIGAAGGDLSGSYPNPTVARLQGRAVSSAAPSSGQALKWNGSAWAPANDDTGASLWQASGSNIFYNAGNVGIGVSNPLYHLHVETNASALAIYGLHTATSGTTYGVFGLSASTSGRGVVGLAIAASGFTYGVLGQSDSPNGIGVVGLATATSGLTYGVSGQSGSPDGYGVYSWGRFAATGTKSFQIDHPLRPETHYLNHFCAEGPEPYNLYRGTVVLDARGEAWVQLPDYFEAINRDPTISLTPVGTPMPNLHVTADVHNNRFKIAGGAPGKKVFWRVEAIRNDRWVQQYGYQTEQEKEEEIKGKYLHPELYGQPKERGIHYRPDPEPAPKETGKP